MPLYAALERERSESFALSAIYLAPAASLDRTRGAP